jgi:hypothetical protein
MLTLMHEPVIVTEPQSYQKIVTEIHDLPWFALSETDVASVAAAYYFFSIQFRENLEIVCALNPEAENLKILASEECNTSNLSPYPGVAIVGEKLNHDEFMRRLLQLAPLEAGRWQCIEAFGLAYLEKMRAIEPTARALSIASFEDGGLAHVFRGMLQSPGYKNPLVKAFRFFLIKHIEFDTDPEDGHGALSGHMKPDARVVPIWQAFKDLLICCTPALGEE